MSIPYLICILLSTLTPHSHCDNIPPERSTGKPNYVPEKRHHIIKQTHLRALNKPVKSKSRDIHLDYYTIILRDEFLQHTVFRGIGGRSSKVRPRPFFFYVILHFFQNF